ncbi:uncharacterized protein LOC110024867 [Phalaenopsis equestris]|uniref:uncharacterized protein LOC110024867 n=1 Tax=Phalaenopsis equestris TaxID=78828 RepID=UPI0009E65D64|nr:uncharacterized protein LOC110024867 [Phalaenopsis equestris]
MSDEIGEDGNPIDQGADITIKDKAVNIMNRGTGTNWMFSLMGKKLWKRKKHKGKISPSSSQMMRTISIHHLECNDFVSQSEVGETSASGSESSKNALSSDSLAMSECESQAHKGTLESAEGKPAYEERLMAPAKVRILTKSASFPGSEFSGSAAGIFLPSYRRMKSVSIVTQEAKNGSVGAFINIAGGGSDPDALPGSHDLMKQREARTVLNRLRNLKERIKDVIMENRKEKKRISRDGILHKVPFGRKLLEDMRHEKIDLWNDSASERCDRGSEGSNFSNAPGGSYSKFAQKSFQHSCSLNESLDRYSKLLETISLKEKEEVSESSKLIQKDGGLLEGKLPKSFGRMISSSVFRSFSFSNAIQTEAYLESSKILAAEPFGSMMNRIVRSKSNREDNVLQQEMLPKNFGRILSSPLLMSYSFSKAVQSEHHLESSQIPTPNANAIISPILERNDSEHEMVVDPDSLFSADKTIRSNEFVTSTVENISEKIESQVNQVSVDDSRYIELSLLPEAVEEEADLVNRHEAQTEAESDIKIEKPSFISSLDPNMVEGSASSVKYLLREGSELQPIPTDEQHLFSDAQNKIYVDPKYDSLFEFVRFVLSQSENEAPGSSYEFGTKTNMPFEPKLLYDLIKEVLLEIYEHSTAPNPWLLHFHSKIRAMPVGIYLVKDVWSEIQWHLCAPQGLDATLDDLMAHDFAKNDGWMNLYREAECFALQLEYLILDDLLDEAVVDSDEFSF